MFTARQKIKKEKGEPTELENQVCVGDDTSRDCAGD